MLAYAFLFHTTQIYVRGTDLLIWGKSASYTHRR